MFWIRKPKFEWIRCVFQAFPPMLPIEEEEESGRVLGKTDKKIEKVISELKKKSPEEIAKELIEFIQKQYPKAITDSILQADAFRLFWIKKGLPESAFYSDLNLKQLKTEVELMAKMNLRTSGPTLTVAQEEAVEVASKTLEELKEKSVDEIVDDILNFWRRNASRYVTSTSWELLRDYLRERGLGYQSIFDIEKVMGVELRQKLENVRNILSVRLFEEREKETAKKIDELAQSLLPKFKDWLIKKGIPRASRNVVNVFLQEVLKEGGITLPPTVTRGRLSETLYIYAKTDRASDKITGKEYKVWTME
jgi:hypothetical protein